MDFVLIIGGNSDIGKAIAKEYAKKSFNIKTPHASVTPPPHVCIYNLCHRLGGVFGEYLIYHCPIRQPFFSFWFIHKFPK